MIDAPAPYGLAVACGGVLALTAAAAALMGVFADFLGLSLMAVGAGVVIAAVSLYDSGD